MADVKWDRAHFDAIYREFLGGEDDDEAKARRRARILSAATELFLRHGYRKASVDEIARAARVAKGTVYLYFPSKSAILMQAIAVEKRALIDRLGPVIDGELPEPDRLHFVVREMLMAVKRLPLVSRMMRRDDELMSALDEMDEELLKRSHGIGQQFMMDLLEAASPGVFSREEKRARADVLISLQWMTGKLLDGRVRNDRDFEQFARVFADVVVYGATNPPASEDAG